MAKDLIAEEAPDLSGQDESTACLVRAAARYGGALLNRASHW